MNKEGYVCSTRVSNEAIKIGALSKLEYKEVECPLSMPSCHLMMTADLVNLGDSNILPLSEKGPVFGSYAPFTHVCITP